eukprot:7124444-Pyramimonas_sp.AAC.1
MDSPSSGGAAQPEGAAGGVRAALGGEPVCEARGAAGGGAQGALRGAAAVQQPVPRVPALCGGQLARQGAARHPSAAMPGDQGPVPRPRAQPHRHQVRS